MTEAPLLFARVTMEGDDGEFTGDTAELLVPKWFSKNPETSHDDDRAALEASARRAFDVMKEDAAQTAFDHWLRAQRTLVETETSDDPLVAMFGVALIEKAVIDGICRSRAQSFFEALDADTFALRFGEIDERLDGWRATELGPRAAHTKLRHTVGLVDDLERSSRSSADPDDGHPATLVADIEAYGLDCFKLKVSGDGAADIERLERIARLTPPASTFTLDGNEQYGDPSALADVLDTLEERGECSDLVRNIVSIEQPVSRRATFDPATRPGIARLSERAPVIIDEADATLDAYPRARELGYGGVSMKACKGVFRALLNRARIDVDGTGFQSAEDLTNLPTLPLLQDLAVVSALRLPHVERNGHHYFRGSDHLKSAEREHLLRFHPDLFDPDGRLRIASGSISLASLDRPGFGFDGPTVLSE